MLRLRAGVPRSLDSVRFQGLTEITFFSVLSVVSLSLAWEVALAV